MKRHAHLGFTLIELLVIFAILGVLAAAMLPGIQAARDAAQRNQCSLNLTRIVQSVHRHEAAHTHFPPGVRDEAGPIVNHPTGLHQGWMIELLPYVDQPNAFQHVDRQASVYGDSNAAVRRLSFPAFRCPVQSSVSSPIADYAGVHHEVETPIDADNHGVLFLNSRITIDDVSDGLAQTLFLGEKFAEVGDLGWMSGTRATLRNTGLPLNVTGASPPPAGGFQHNAIDDEFGGYGEYDYGLIDGGEEWLDDDEIESPRPAEKPQQESTDEPPEWAPAGFLNRVEPMRSPQYVGGFSSPHRGGVYFAFGDGRVQFLADAVDPRLLQQMAHRSDGQPTSPTR